MKKFARAGSTFGTVVAAAVVIAVASTGGAVAGGLITSKQIKNNTIKSIDVRNNTLKSIDVRDGSLGAADLAAGSVNSGKVASGAITASKLGTIVERSESVAIANGAGGFVQVSCLAGETLLSGGATTAGVGIASGWTLIRSAKVGTNTWDAAAWNATGGGGNLIVRAYCLQ